MHRTSARPAPLEFLSPSSHSVTFGIDRRKDSLPLYVLPRFAPGYLETSVRDHLRTQPADEMGTKYQQPQYNGYTSRKEHPYPTPASTNPFGTSYSGVIGDGRRYSTISQPAIQAPQNELQNQRSYVPVGTPPTANKEMAPLESLQRQKSATADMIVPNLQIPSTINNSGGSLAEFAAQVCLPNNLAATSCVY